MTEGQIIPPVINDLTEIAIDLVNKRILPSRIQTELVERGMEQSTAAALVSKLMRKADLNRRLYRNYTAAMWTGGLLCGFGVLRLSILFIVPGLITFFIARQKRHLMSTRSGIQGVGIPKLYPRQ
ncbi:MAG: hypothetical protein ACKOBW_08460 [Planctomycetota bacterium]